MNSKFKKIVACLLAGTMLGAMLSGCGGNGKSGSVEDGKVVIKIGDAPDPEVKPKEYERMMETVANFEAEHPNIKVELDYWTFDTKSYAAKAEGETLPTVYYVPLTEAKRIMDMEYAADITDEMKNRGYYDHISDFMMKNISRDGKIYFYTTSLYDVGLMVNMDLFRQAGLVDEDGTPKQPKDWYEMAEMAMQVKAETGKSGFIMPTMGNCGGWRFTPIAWSFGVEFMKKDEDGKWKATFDTPECVEALQFVKDLKWKYDVLPQNTLISNDEVLKQMGLGESAMTFSEQNSLNAMVAYGLMPETVGMVRIPAGPKRQVTLMGGAYKVIDRNATPEQISAVFDWLEFNGSGRELTDERKANIQKSIDDLKDQNRIVGLVGVSPWNDDDEVTAYTNNLYAEQANIDLNQIKLYNDKTGLEFQEEEPIEAQTLYSLLDTCIQEVLNNKDADCAMLIKKAASDFQSNCLDYAE